MKRKVLFVTGIRSEYDIQYSVIRAISSRSNMEAGIVITGAHLAPMYGNTAVEVERDGFPVIARIESLLNSDSKSARIKSAAIQLLGLVDVVRHYDPTFLVAPMDREEAVAVALTGSYVDVPVVHIGGGETAEDGNVDNGIRHAVSKLAHLHMVSTAGSAERLIRMGEESWRIHVVGAAGLDRFMSTPDVGSEALWKAVGFDPEGGHFAVLIQHSIISSVADSGELMALTLESLAEMQVPTFISYPNSDAGSQIIIGVIDRFVRNHPRLFYKYRSLPRPIFVSLLRRASVLVGNSSCGIIEAPLFNLPVVNIGPRQRGREHADNVLFVDHDKTQIQHAVNRAIEDKEFRERASRSKNPYGDGRASERIADILESQTLDQKLTHKLNTV